MTRACLVLLLVVLVLVRSRSRFSAALDLRSDADSKIGSLSVAEVGGCMDWTPSRRESLNVKNPDHSLALPSYCPHVQMIYLLLLLFLLLLLLLVMRKPQPRWAHLHALQRHSTVKARLHVLVLTVGRAY